MKTYQQPQVLRYKLRQTRAASLIEYIVLVMLIAGALYTMHGRILGGIGAKAKSVGETFSYGRQFDAKRTVACKQDVDIDSRGNPKFHGTGVPDMGVWYDENCYQSRVIREVKLNDDGTFDSGGGCPQCFAQDLTCFKCEDDIKRSCESDSCAQ